MAVHIYHDVVLEVRDSTSAREVDLCHLLRDFSFTSADSSTACTPTLVLTVRLSDRPLQLPDADGAVYAGEGLRAVDRGDEAYVSEGSSLLHLQVRLGRGDAQLAPGFFRRSRLVRHRFWAFGLLRLLRVRGLYGLHAAGVETPAGNLLFVGPSGAGKSTLAIGLLRSGCRYLSDDAILLRGQPDAVEALALRKPFSIDAAAANDYADLQLGPEGSSSSGKRKRRADVQTAYGRHYLPGFRPDVILFPRIVSRTRSSLRPLPSAIALRHLLAQSGPELFDRASMASHLNVLTRLVRQTATYELCAGRDLHRSPEILFELLSRTEGPVRGQDNSRADESMQPALPSLL